MLADRGRCQFLYITIFPLLVHLIVMAREDLANT